MSLGDRQIFGRLASALSLEGTPRRLGHPAQLKKARLEEVIALWRP